MASQHPRLGVRLRAVLHRPGWGGAIRLHNVMLQATMPVDFDVEWLGDAASPVIIWANKWGEAYKPLSRLPVQAVQSNMVYQPREVVMVSTSMAARRINANR